MAYANDTTSYDQYYYQHSIEYGIPPPAQYNQVPQSNHFYPYSLLSNNLPSAHSYAQYDTQENQMHTLQSFSAAFAQGYINPNLVSSSYPIQHNWMHSSRETSNVFQDQTDASTSQSVFIRKNSSQSIDSNSWNNRNDLNVTSSTDTENEMTPFGYFNSASPPGTPPGRQSTDYNIVDLDSQQMLHSHNIDQQGPLPPMNSIDNRLPMWSHDANSLFKPIARCSTLPQFPNELRSPIFPQTTTPQVNTPQFRTLETESPSPNDAPLMNKSRRKRASKTNWCSICTKGFTSYGHLRRHYKTTLHKNGVKASGEPDPADLTISAYRNFELNSFDEHSTVHQKVLAPLPLSNPVPLPMALSCQSPMPNPPNQHHSALTDLLIDVDKSKSNAMPAEVENDLPRCDPCNKVFSKCCYLTQHNNVFHAGERPYKCYICGKRFECEKTRDKHTVKHGGDKPFKCQQCIKQFNYSTDLQRHMFEHNGKPYRCDVCNRSFTRRDHLFKHGMTHTQSRRNKTDVKPKAAKTSTTTKSVNTTQVLKASKTNKSIKVNEHHEIYKQGINPNTVEHEI